MKREFISKNILLILNCQQRNFYTIQKRLLHRYNFNSAKKSLTGEIKDLIYEHKIKTDRNSDERRGALCRDLTEQAPAVRGQKQVREKVPAEADKAAARAREKMADKERGTAAAEKETAAAEKDSVNKERMLLMPGFDITGTFGMGAMTRRRRGFCNPAYSTEAYGRMKTNNEK